MFDGCSYEAGEKADAGRGATDEQPLSDEPALMQYGETYSTWQ